MVTIRFKVRRVEESADIDNAQANTPEPTGVEVARKPLPKDQIKNQFDYKAVARG
jgi:hypothetical protein